MKNTIDSFLSLNNFHWQGSAFQWIFYAAIVLTLIFEKRKMLRIVFGWVPILFLALIFNPVCKKMMNLAGLSSPAYFTRLFSFMPLMYVIARGFTLFLRIRNRWFKLAAVSIICVVICLSGKNIYHESWFIKAENFEKTPNETLEIIETINTLDDDDDEIINVAVIDDNAVYLRQIADYITPYGRNNDQFMRLLSMDPPDVLQVMEMAGQKDVDYVVVHRAEATLAAFAEKGYEPRALTTSYAIFEVVGVPRKKRMLNDKRQVESIYWIDSMQVPEDGKETYYKVVYKYDANGNRIKETYLDRADNPFFLNGGFCSIQKTYYLNGKMRSIAYLNQNDEPILLNGRYKTRFNYDTSGRVRSEYYLDRASKPMPILDDLYYARELTYHPTGKIESETYYDAHGRKMKSASGYSCVKKDYDDNMELISESFYDVDGREIGRVGSDEPIQDRCMESFVHSSMGATVNNDEVRFSTSIDGNLFRCILFQLYDAESGAYLTSFGRADETGLFEGKYLHELPSGIYKMEFKVNTPFKDESISSLEYLTEGETLYYEYHIDEMKNDCAEISGLYIGRKQTR